MHHEHPAAGLGDGVDETQEVIPLVIVIDAKATLHRDRHLRHRRDHRRHRVGHQSRLAHQTRTEAPGLHAVGGASAVEVDFIETMLGPDPRRLRQQRRLAAAQLQGHRMLDRIQRQQP